MMSSNKLLFTLVITSVCACNVERAIQQLLDEHGVTWESSTGGAGSAPVDSTSATTTTSGTGGLTFSEGLSASGQDMSSEGSSAGSGSSSDASSSGGLGDIPMVTLKVEPSHLGETGQALLLLSTDADVVKVRLSMNGVALVELTPADFPYTYEALSAKDNGTHLFTVEVEDEEGLTAMASAELTVQLPPSGAERCLFEDKTAKGSMITAMVYTDAAIVAGGWRDTGAGAKAAIWKLDPDHCEVVLPGWPKTIANWGDPNLGVLASTLSAVAVDEAGNIAVGGNLVVAGKPQRYTALLTEGGARLWERAGLVGEVVTSVVITGDDLVISGGWKFTSDNPPRTDAMLWRHLADASVTETTLKAPFTADELPDNFNELSEKIRAMLIEPETGYLVVAGERDVKTDGINVYTRAFIARFVPLGGLVGSPSTSPGDAFKHDAVNSIAVCGDKLIAGGWTRDDEDPKVTPPQPLFRLASKGIWAARLVEPMLATELRGAACDREGKVVGAGVWSGGPEAKVFAFSDPLGPRTWYETGTVGSWANGLGCDARGFCAWAGHRTLNGKSVAVVRVHHP